MSYGQGRSMWGRDRFNRPRKIVRVNVSKKADGCSIDGLGTLYIEVHKAGLYKLTVSNAKTRKSDRHRGWAEVVYCGDADDGNRNQDRQGPRRQNGQF
jgi:hypothetical protein